MDFILEIGTEEIPSGYILGGLAQLKEATGQMLDKNRISYGSINTYGTPRRIVLIVEDIAEKQEDTVKERKGPPKSVSFDKDGNPTKAALSFAKKNNVEIKDIQIINTPKGEYLFIKKVVSGAATYDVLKQEIPKLISQISWPKSMRWSDVKFSFARPIHWILCLLDGKVVPFEIAGVKTGNITFGHRFMAPNQIEIYGVKDYLDKIKKAYVIVDPEERKRMVWDGVKREAEKIGGIPEEDPELLESVSNLVEYPFPVCGSFEKRFLTLPKPVIITPMKEHQKYFPIYEKEGNKLMPNFVAVNNTIPKDPELVKKGHERVLKARLADAEFFFKEDQKIPLLDRLEELKGIIYHAQLGTSYDKVERFTELAEYICDLIAPDLKRDANLLCRLCKCDLTTLMVSEFPDLQGIMGREYARLEGYPMHICDAIYEHYLPVGSSEKLPDSPIGAIVGIADRMDTICAYFGIGIKPTGSADPIGLRRHAIAIIRILEDKGWQISLKDLIARALEIISRKIRLKSEIEQIKEEVIAFFKDRYRFMRIAEGIPAETVDAVISVSFDQIAFLKDRIKQIQEFISKAEDKFQELVLTAKRVNNILKKQKEKYEVNESFFKTPQEQRLWKIYLDVKEKINKSIENKDYIAAINYLILMKEPVDELFDNVEILTKEDELRKNRIGLVQHVQALFKKIADFSKFPY